MENSRIITCFVASPGDTLQEREICEKVMREINTSLGSALGFRLETRKWEKDVHPSIGTDGQDVINRQIGLDYDIFIGIMYKRFGSPTPRAGSGTEEEFDRALALHEKHPEVEIMFYFNREATDLDQIDYEQFGKVNAFREKVRKAGCLTWDYKGPEAFEGCLRKHLLMRLTEISKPHV